MCLANDFRKICKKQAKWKILKIQQGNSYLRSIFIKLRFYVSSQSWWYMPLNLALKTQSQTDFFEFEAILVYIGSARTPRNTGLD